MSVTPTHVTPVRLAIVIAALAALAGAGLVLILARDWTVAAGFLGAAVAIAGIAIAWRLLAPVPPPGARVIDWSLARAIADTCRQPVAVTDRGGHLVCANDAYLRLFPDLPTPPGLPFEGAAIDRLAAGAKAAWRDGAASLTSVEGHDVELTRAGDEADMLVWRIAPLTEEATDPVELLCDVVRGAPAATLAQAAAMAAVVSADGVILAADPGLVERAGQGGALAGRDLGGLVASDARGLLRFAHEGQGGPPLRFIEIPLSAVEDAPLLLVLIDDPVAVLPLAGGALSTAEHVRALVALMPFSMALVDREGRFTQMNTAFVRAAGVDPAALPLYPGDLVVREDKAAIADAVRRFAGGATHSTDMAVRLKGHPDEPVALTIAGARGLGDAAAILSLKNNAEEIRLKREVAQATKMQAVGQLAGGVAHDFNNILTAILGHCDLMLMRHAPGDSDYDDIQQIRTNSNRAASLTRQLLAFSRQQTLRPQVLQLPDVVSEVSTLLKRLMGETVRLDVSHGRNLGPVRADPGQLEQVVVNLAVNARDAMLTANPKGGGTLTIQTRAVSADEVRAMNNDVLPVADYTALSVSDTGTGIPPEIQGKIFEPFFTTKETGKGTGLGLSTVYGIVKQSGGWIFAESRPGKGATFTMYLPIHTAAGTPRLAAPEPPPVRAAALWGQGTILLVEDEDMVRAVAERALARQGYTVITAENGEAALELLEAASPPDLLVSDVVMPLMDGPTMVGKVRERYPDLPVLFMSGYAEEQLRRSIDLDNVAFLPKPFSVQQLAEAVGMALAAPLPDRSV